MARATPHGIAHCTYHQNSLRYSGVPYTNVHYGPLHIRGVSHLVVLGSLQYPQRRTDPYHLYRPTDHLEHLQMRPFRLQSLGLSGNFPRRARSCSIFGIAAHPRRFLAF